MNNIEYPLKTASITTIAVANAIKTSIATSASPATYTTFNGSLGGGPYTLTRNVSVTSSSHTGSYTTASPIVFTGTDINGNVITDSLSLTSADGGETIYGVKAFKTITKIQVPAQTDTSGAFTFGLYNAYVTDYVYGVLCGGAGNLHVTYGDGTVDTVPFSAGQSLIMSPVKIWGDSTATNVSVVIPIR